MDDFYAISDYDDIDYEDNDYVFTVNDFFINTDGGRESVYSAPNYSLSNSDDSVSVGSDEIGENEYKNELLKAIDRLNNAVNKLGEIKTKSDCNCIFLLLYIILVLCSICYLCPREYAYLPCGHFCVCEKCMKKTKKTKPNQCPLCKQQVSECQRIYL